MRYSWLKYGHVFASQARSDSVRRISLKSCETDKSAALEGSETRRTLDGLDEEVEAFTRKVYVLVAVRKPVCGFYGGEMAENSLLHRKL